MVINRKSRGGRERESYSRTQILYSFVKSEQMKDLQSSLHPKKREAFYISASSFGSDRKRLLHQGLSQGIFKGSLT